MFAERAANKAAVTVQSPVSPQAMAEVYPEYVPDEGDPEVSPLDPGLAKDILEVVSEISPLLPSPSRGAHVTAPHVTGQSRHGTVTANGQTISNSLIRNLI